MEKEIVNIRVKLPKDFNIQLVEDQLDRLKKGCKPLSKEALLIKYAKIGRLQELKNENS